MCICLIDENVQCHAGLLGHCDLIRPLSGFKYVTKAKVSLGPDNSMQTMDGIRSGIWALPHIFCIHTPSCNQL